MDVKDKVVVVTGGAEGIGAALCRRFASAGAAVVVVVDRNGEGTAATATAIGGEVVTLDVTDGPAMAAMVADVEARHGRIDLFCSNAGVGDLDKANAASSPDAVWTRAWNVNVMAHVHAARAVTPAHGGPRRGLYPQHRLGGRPALPDRWRGLFDHQARGHRLRRVVGITYGDQGIKVSVLCPQGVDTAMLRVGGDNQPQNLEGVMTPDEVADSVIEGLAVKRFLVLPHPVVLTYMQRKTGDYDCWLGGMRRLRAKVIAAA